MPHVNLKDLKYLALEGGGGKGVVYSGAIEALEQLKVLPIEPNRRRIVGISGSSAGAITALALALGMTSGQIGSLLKKKEIFEGFFDKLNPGTTRIINRKGHPGVDRTPAELMRKRRDSIDWLVTAAASWVKNTRVAPPTQRAVFSDWICNFTLIELIQ